MENDIEQMFVSVNLSKIGKYGKCVEFKKCKECGEIKNEYPDLHKFTTDNLKCHKLSFDAKFRSFSNMVQAMEANIISKINPKLDQIERACKENKRRCRDKAFSKSKELQDLIKRQQKWRIRQVSLEDSLGASDSKQSCPCCPPEPSQSSP